jgi:Fungal protein kinase
MLLRPDFVAMPVPQRAEAPSPVDATDASSMIEMKFDHAVKGNPPKLHDFRSGLPSSAFEREISSKTSKWTAHEQILEYGCVALSAQGPSSQSIVDLLVTHMRLQLNYTDRAGCMMSEEHNFSDDFSTLFAALIGIYVLATQHAGRQPEIIRLRGSRGTPLSASDFDPADRVVMTGATAGLSRSIAPVKVMIHPESNPTEQVAVYAYGANLMERLMPLDESAAQKVCKKNSRARTRLSIAGLRKSKRLEKGQVVATKRHAKLPRRFAPRCIFGSGLARYSCVLEGDTEKLDEMTLQLSWQPKDRVSEASVLRLANEAGVCGVPTLVGSCDLANMDDGKIRSRLRSTFQNLDSIRPVNMVLRAIVWKEDSIPLSSVNNIVELLCGFESILRSMSK